MTRKRWCFAAAAFALGLLYTSVLAILGVEVRVGGRDVALPLAASTELAFGVFGFFIGRAAEARVSDRRSMEKLAALQARLLHAEKLTTVGRVASRIAHEVRNPLAIMRAMVQNLEEGAASEEPRRACRQVIEEIDRLSHVTASLLSLSRPVQPRVTEVGASEVVARVEWLARRLVEGKPLSIQVAPGPPAARLRADPDLACQALLGLVSNAAEAAKEGTIDLMWDESGDQVVFRVSDRGPGVPAEIRERIFDPFFTTKPAGAGLGLAVAREVAAAQDGDLALEDSTGKGARFALRLPKATSGAS